MRRRTRSVLSAVVFLSGCYLLFAGIRAAFLFNGHKSGIYRLSNVALLLIGSALIWLALRLYRRLDGRLARFAKPS